MRDLVNRKSFLIRKFVDNLLYWLFPNTWVPLYNSVHFSRMPFKKCTANRVWQEKVSTRVQRMTEWLANNKKSLIDNNLNRSFKILYTSQSRLFVH